MTIECIESANHTFDKTGLERNSRFYFLLGIFSLFHDVCVCVKL